MTYHKKGPVSPFTDIWHRTLKHEENITPSRLMLIRLINDDISNMFVMETKVNLETPSCQPMFFFRRRRHQGALVVRL